MARQGRRTGDSSPRRASSMASSTATPAVRTLQATSLPCPASRAASRLYRQYRLSSQVRHPPQSLPKFRAANLRPSHQVRRLRSLPRPLAANPVRSRRRSQAVNLLRVRRPTPRRGVTTYELTVAGASSTPGRANATAPSASAATTTATVSTPARILSTSTLSLGALRAGTAPGTRRMTAIASLRFTSPTCLRSTAVRRIAARSTTVDPPSALLIQRPWAPTLDRPSSRTPPTTTPRSRPTTSGRASGASRKCGSLTSTTSRTACTGPTMRAG
mmetsp:Transcript_2307/g.4716  ORF Transcript_2307/g.4716 Transcript_2307/m.4716 type:complete len:273 (-) Transcript_2307:400-1218(-)